MGRTGLSDVRSRVGDAAAAAGRVDDVELVVVTKYADDDAVRAVIEEGATTLGENRSGSLVRRSETFPDVEWHFIGSLQRNKVGVVRPITAMLHSMDRIPLARKWGAGDGARVPPVLIEVNLAGEAQKGGVAPADVESLIEACHESGVEVRGLMTVPPRPEHPSDSARWFSRLRLLRDRLRESHPRVVELSMGMSDDFEVAVAEGATILRVGRAIFEPFRNEG